jgi:hypothetical protein
MSTNQPSRQQKLKVLIDRAINKRAPPEHRWIYAYGLLSELLSYSAQDQMEVWTRLRELANDDEQE